MTRWLAIVLLCAATALRAATFTAASASLSDVTNAIALASAGDTVQVPAGTASWTSSVTLVEVSLIGAGIGQTVITDEVPRTGGHASGIVVSSGATNLLRVSGFTFQGGSVTDGVQDGFITCYGRNPAIRIDHCRFQDLYNVSIMFREASVGVVDHCQFYNSFFFNGVKVYTGGIFGDYDYRPVAGYGDKSWVEPAAYGTTNGYVYIEDCHFWYPNMPGDGVDDLGAGGRACFRFNMVTNNYFQAHGTESSGRIRGGRCWELYGNTFVNTDAGATNSGNAFGLRSGTGLIYSNHLWGYGGLGLSLVNLRSSTYYAPWGSDNGQLGWDSNNPIAVVTGTMAGGTNGQYWLTDTNASWSSNQWIGYTLQNVSGGGTNSGQFGLILKNDEHNIWIMKANQPYQPDGGHPAGYVTYWTNGQDYAIYQVYAKLDQIGWGQGDLIQDTATDSSVPVNSQTGLPSWPNQVSEPAHIWANTDINGTVVDAVANTWFEDLGPVNGCIGGNNDIILNRDFTNGVLSGYTPLVYPHPLTQTGGGSFGVWNVKTNNVGTLIIGP